MARRSEHSQEEIKEMVLQAAETIVVEEGFPALKVRKIALEIGYTVGSIYMVFENMADLIMHVKGRTLDDLSEQLDRVVEQCDTPEECIVELAKAYVAFASHNYHRWSMIFEQCLNEEMAIPDWYQHKVNQMFVRIDELFQQLTLDTPLENTQLAARALWSGVHGVCMLSLTGKLDLVGVKNIENIVVLLVENFLKGWKQGEE